MIIALSGKIGSGKDTICDIIQWLTNPRIHTNPNVKIGEDSFASYVSFEDWQNGEKLSAIYTDVWKNKKFADKLKDIVCLLIGCTREQLEDSDFKNKELGEEWTIWKILYIDNFESFWRLFNSEKEAKDWIESCSDPLDCRALEKEILTPRKFLQLIGTDLFRNQLHPNIWVNSLFSEYEGVINTTEKSNEKVITKNCKAGDKVWHFPYNWELKTLSEKDIDDGIWGTGNGNERFSLSNCYKPRIDFPNWIITDLRFPNELEAVRIRGGITIRVNRPQLIPRDFEHESEKALDDYRDWDYVIENDSDIDSLIIKVKEILIKEQIIK